MNPSSGETQDHGKKMKAKATEIRLLSDDFETNRKAFDKTAHARKKGKIDWHMVDLNIKISRILKVLGAKVDSHIDKARY